MKAMESCQSFPMDGKVDVDETYVGGQDEEAIERTEGKKKIMVVAVERKGKGVSRRCGRFIETADKKNLRNFMCESIHKYAQVRTDGWTGCRGLESEFPNLEREKSEKRAGIFRNCTVMFKA